MSLSWCFPVRVNKKHQCVKESLLYKSRLVCVVLPHFTRLHLYSADSQLHRAEHTYAFKVTVSSVWSDSKATAQLTYVLHECVGYTLHCSATSEEDTGTRPPAAGWVSGGFSFQRQARKKKNQHFKYSELQAWSPEVTRAHPITVSALFKYTGYTRCSLVSRCWQNPISQNSFSQDQIWMQTKGEFLCMLILQKLSYRMGLRVDLWHFLKKQGDFWRKTIRCWEEQAVKYAFLLSCQDRYSAQWKKQVIASYF